MRTTDPGYRESRQSIDVGLVVYTEFAEQSLLISQNTNAH